MTHKFDKASAETLDTTKSKEIVNLVQLLTYVFLIFGRYPRSRSTYLIFQSMVIDQTRFGFVLVDLLNPHCMLIYVAQALLKLYRFDLIIHSSILVCAKKVRNHIINSLTSD